MENRKEGAPSLALILSHVSLPPALRRLDCVAMVNDSFPCVLVVDDNEDVRYCLASILSLSGYAILQAGNGQEALAVVEEHGFPHAIVLDLNMPVMDGYAFLEHRAAHPDLSCVPVLVISGAVDSEQARAHGATDCLAKPVAIPILLDALTSLLDPC